MADLLIEVPTALGSMIELRPRLDAALAEQFPGGMLQRRWEGDVLHVWGPGAKGTITFEGGRLVGRAELAPPASLMKGLIEQKISAALKGVST
jgi:putative polyhydroxyalkanoic acid system protein